MTDSSLITLLTEISRQVGQLDGKLDAVAGGQLQLHTTLTDHGVRIDALERDRDGREGAERAADKRLVRFKVAIAAAGLIGVAATVGTAVVPS